MVAHISLALYILHVIVYIKQECMKVFALFYAHMM